VAAKSKQITAKLDELTVAQGKLTAEADRIRAALENIRPSSTISSLKRSLMELPIIDGFNSHLKIVQDWVPKLKITLGMAKIARFDRCRTCHQNIDKTGPGGVPAYPAGHPETGDVAEWIQASAFPQPSQLTRIQTCTVLHQVLTQWGPLAVPSVMMVRGQAPVSAMPSILRTTRIWLASGIMSTGSTRITSGSTRCSQRDSSNRAV